MVIKKSQILNFELILGLSLLSLIVFIPYNNLNNNKGIFLEIDTLANSLIKNNNFRLTILSENLSSQNLNNNWSAIENILNKSYKNYFLSITNTSIEKIVFNCSGKFKNKIVTEKIIYIYNNTYADFRILKLGVCY